MIQRLLKRLPLSVWKSEGVWVVQHCLADQEQVAQQIAIVRKASGTRWSSSRKALSRTVLVLSGKVRRDGRLVRWHVKKRPRIQLRTIQVALADPEWREALRQGLSAVVVDATRALDGDSPTPFNAFVGAEPSAFDGASKVAA